MIHAKVRSFIDHAAKHTAYFPASITEGICLGFIDVSAIEGDVNPMLSFLLFTVRACQFANEAFLILPVSPGFGDLRSYRTRRTADLISQGVNFFLRKSLCRLENRHCKLP